MRRYNWLVLLVVLLIVASLFVIPVVVRDARQRQYARAQQVVRSHSGELTFDLVDGNYMLVLTGDAASDETIRSLVPTLKELPTGFTLLGPGESRMFCVTLHGSTLTDVGLASLCDLRLSQVTLYGGSITGASVAQLASAHDLVHIILNDVGLSDAEITDLRACKPKAMVVVDGVSE